MGNPKSILFVCYGLGIGGIERCLVNLLNAMPEEEFDVDLLVMNPEYALRDQIRRKVTYLDPFLYTLNTRFTMTEIRRRGGLLRHKKRFLAYFDHRVRIKLGLPLWTTFSAIPKHYDIAVAYSQNGLAPYYVTDKVTAGRKVLWYHNGAYEKTGRDYARDQVYYGKFDRIVAVSPSCAEVLREKFPALTERILVLRNLCDRERILQGAEDPTPESFRRDAVHIVTVARLAPEKGPDLALEACRILCRAGRNICWHWVGGGHPMKRMRQEISRLGLSDSFLLEGDRPNPYPYIRNAAIYVQPSHYEAYSMTVMEAKVLAKPMVITRVGGMQYLLRDGETGKITVPTAEALAEAVGELIDHPDIAASFSENLQKESAGGTGELDAYRETVFA
ncbi:MAG: glycosyltransferase [Clostridiales bacterium]|nr:glycosyltransferase [Clostridiales bacterium]